ncbi:glycogen debranching protein GlgX [Rhizobiales bacterium RZME27]|uniref:Glycogen debranching protein GlgX n=1 Tax=Endobacterium cereale TaxID=2663029 RepID=A0A6A8AHP2_9HYPH|nr:glycogen debranching protein GlgX [Endobacterium cereale]MEB2845627.1 glycogen debranching protein GlgX [Endobacterium cereale]MQY48746.1 glycogen debranching protein GlgX [Endobacterium cereale]
MRLGATLTANGADFAIWSSTAEKIELCLFDADGKTETARHALTHGENDVHYITLPGITAGQRYGFRAHGTYDPDHGLWFDPSKLLIDPYARELDRPFRHDVRLMRFGEDTADIVPKAIVTSQTKTKVTAPKLKPGGFVYEVAVRPFTMLHPDVLEQQRGTIAALAHPSVIAHLKNIGVDAIELMPITAWIDERHLPPLGLTNGWGYNPVAFMALDPRLCPGGMSELRKTVATLHEAGIDTILDLVFNHTGESDRYGATLSMRGLDNLSYYRHLPDAPDVLVNDTGTGNTVACDHPIVQRLIIDTLRHFVLEAGIDGFRFDLAPVLGRTANGFVRDGGTLSAILADDVLADRIMIAEPWDIGPGGYQLGNFPSPFLEWNDRARDDLRRYWRGDNGLTGTLASALAGTSSVFSQHGLTQTRSVNFLAAHDGFTLMDLVSHEHKHNEANGENNRDGHGENLSWNNGTEGATEDDSILENRRRDVIALLSTLFVSRGTVMLTAGDEGGRSQGGNNNAYCQDNAITWVDWQKLDPAIIAHTAFLSSLRKRFPAFADTAFLTGEGDIEWFSARGEVMTVGDWERGDASTLTMVLATPDRETGQNVRIAVLFNRGHDTVEARLPGNNWQALASPYTIGRMNLPPRSVSFASGL